MIPNTAPPPTRSDKIKILWTPRWTPKEKNESRIGGSHFMEYKDDFIALSRKYGNKIALFFRPHMNLFSHLVKENFMSKEEIASYKESLKNNKITRCTDMSDLDKYIVNIDIFLADYSSILIELFLTGRPIIYCEFPNAKPFPEYEEMFAAMYIAKSWEDVEKYLDDLIAGNDYLFEKRREIAKKIYETHKDATEKIIESIIEDFNQSLM